MKLELGVVSILLITSIILSSISYFPETNELSSPKADSTFTKSDSVYINITNNSAFIDYGWTGSGTEVDPYMLANQALGLVGDIGYLEIRGTDAHFVIQNCHLTLMDIVFWSTSNGKIKDCMLINSSVTVGESSNCTITDNIFSYNVNDGETIWLVDSITCEITQNSFSNGFAGIFLDNSNGTIISENSFSDFIYGGISGDLASTTLTNNDFIGTGIKLEYWYARLAQNLPVFENNTVNGMDLGIFFNLFGAQIDGEQYGQIVLSNCNDTTITGGMFVNCATGVQLAECNNCTLDGINVSDCSWNGINIESCLRVSITNCIVRNCLETGIFLSASPLYTIENCTLEDNLDGILPHIYSNNGTIVNCTIIGINSDINGNGINLSTNSTAIGNIISENHIGIFVYGSHCHVVNNSVVRNGYGIYIGAAYTGYGETPYANRIYGNEIGWNSLGNAYDRGYFSNEWDDGVSIGNSWSDYYGIGYYVIYRDVVDHYPKLLPEDAISLFYIHLGVGVTSSVVIVVILTLFLKRRSRILEQAQIPLGPPSTS